MGDIVPSKSIDIQRELANLQLYKNHPNGILDISLNRLKDMLDGKIEVVDPSNPFLYMLETSCLNTAFAVQEMALISKEMYPRLANSEQELYRHMSDVDYLGRFSSPSTGIVRFQILINEFKSRAYKDQRTNDRIVTIPKHFQVEVDGYVFTLPVPIEVRITEDNVIAVSYKSSYADNIFPLFTNQIEFKRYSYNQQETYITFEVEMPEVKLEMNEIPVEKSKLFKGDFTIEKDRYFYYAKAYYLKNSEWVEMLTTHTDQIYDISVPTCIFKVDQTNSSINYYIPPVYVNSGRLGTKVRFVVYSTKGSINVNFSDYRFSDFKHEYNPVFPETDLDETTKALNMINKLVYLERRIQGGRGPKTFEELKADVIDNNLGRDHKPVTNVQIERYIGNRNLRIIREVDIVTNRIFLLETSIPFNPGRIELPKPDLGIIEFAINISDLKTNKNAIVDIGAEVTIIPEGTLFEYDLNELKILSNLEADIVKSLSGNELVKEVNSRRLLSCYYHYILDTGNGETSLRPYDISNPKVSLVNFKDYNSTTRIGANTTSTNIVKTSTGFQLDVLTNISIYDELYNANNISAFLSIEDSEGTVFLLEGVRFTYIEDMPVFRFSINSDFYIDERHMLKITNFLDEVNVNTTITVPLDATMNLIYFTNNLPPFFKPTAMDRYSRSEVIPSGVGVVTLEALTIKFGTWLKYLYSRVHTSTGLEDYLVYSDNVVALYDKTVYASDNTILHYKGETMLDENNLPIVIHQKGDMVLDENGDPTIGTVGELVRYLNLMFVDYRFNLDDYEATIEYRKYLKDYLKEVIVEDVRRIQDSLLENTVGYLTVPSKLNNVVVRYDGITRTIAAGQVFFINVYVDRVVYDDAITRTSLEKTMTDTLEEYLENSRELSRSMAASKLLDKVKDFVKSLSIVGFTELNSEYIKVVNEGEVLGFNKELVYGTGGYRVQNSVRFSFMLVE